MNYKVDPVYGCHLWQGKLDHDGYPTTGWGRAYGPYKLEEGWEWDHLCRRKTCIRPEHLEKVTKTENLRRMRMAHRFRRQLCAAGHELYYARRTPEGGRICLTCAPLEESHEED